MKRKTLSVAAEPQAPNEPTVTENPFTEIGNALAALEEQGKLPEGFDLEAACSDPTFAALVQEFEPYAAVRIYDAEQRAARAESAQADAEKTAMQKMTEQLSARNALPRSQKPNHSIPAHPDYRTMSSASFKKLEEQLRTAARNGRKINI